MLSRVAERIYWMMRYLERTESTARLINAYFQTILDLPREAAPGWDLLLDITLSRQRFLEHYTNLNERNIIKFLLTDTWNPGSIIYSVAAARENSRTAREVLTPNMWEELNELYYYIREEGSAAVARRARYEFLRQISRKSQQIIGLIDNVICRTQGYRFLQLGRYMERADMTTRILDAGSTLARQRKKEGDALPYDSLMLRHTLNSLDALTMYRLRIGARIRETGVRVFLLKDVTFPRSTIYCLQQIGEAVLHLPRRSRALAQFSEIQEDLMSTDMSALTQKGLTRYIDGLQRRLIDLDGVIMQTWCARNS